MADQPPIDIRLTTTGDTSGADEVQKSILKVGDASKEAQRDADVQLAKQKQTVAAQKQQAEVLREIADNAQRLVAVNLAKAVGDISRQFGAVSPEVNMATTALESFAATLATTGNIYAAVAALGMSAIGSLVTAHRQAAEAEKASNKQLEDNLKKYGEMREKIVQQIRSEHLEQYFQVELEALEEQERVLGRIYKIRASERELAAAQQAAASAAAMAGPDGVAPQGEAANKLAMDTQNQIATLTDTLEQARSSAKKAQEEATKLAMNASLEIENSDTWIKLTEQAKTAQQAANVAADDLANLQTLTETQIATLRTTASTGMEAIGNEANAALIGMEDKLRASIEQVIAEAGGKASSQLTGGLRGIIDVLSDRIIDPAEIGKLNDALIRIKTSAEATNPLLKEAFGDVAKTLAAYEQTILPFVGLFKKQAADANALRGRVENLENQINRR